MKKAFTILELVVVLSVLVILIGIAIPRIKGMQDSAKIVQAKAELQTMQIAIESYYNNSSPHAYPGPDGLIASPCGVFSAATPQIVPGNCPTDPFTTNSQYALAVTGNYYVFASVGVAGADLSSLSIDSTGLVGGGNGGICATNGTGCS